MNNPSLIKLLRCVFTPFFFACLTLLSVPGVTKAQTGVRIADREMRQWRSFEPEGGNFRISLPIEPKVNSKTLMEEYNNYSEWIVNTAQAETYYSIYTISFAKTPPNLSKDRLKVVSESTASFFSELIQKANGVVKYKKDISKNGVLAYESLIEIQSSTIKFRRYYTPKMIYEVSLATPDLRVATDAITKVYQAESDKFFDSFQILESKKVEVISKGKSKKAKSKL